MIALSHPQENYASTKHSMFFFFTLLLKNSTRFEDSFILVSSTRMSWSDSWQYILQSVHSIQFFLSSKLEYFWNTFQILVYCYLVNMSTLKLSLYTFISVFVLWCSLLCVVGVQYPSLDYKFHRLQDLAGQWFTRWEMLNLLYPPIVRHCSCNQI